MPELILAFVCIVAVVLSEIYDGPDECEMHQWSKNILDDSMTCMHCNKRSDG